MKMIPDISINPSCIIACKVKYSYASELLFLAIALLETKQFVVWSKRKNSTFVLLDKLITILTLQTSK